MAPQPAPAPQLTPEQQQEAWLRDASKAVKQHSFLMKRALDEGNLHDAVRHSGAMLGELRTSLLAPQKYYALYMQAFDELSVLQSFFEDEQASGRSIADLYELVQQSPNIVPRLYLLTVVGAVYVKCKEGGAKDVLTDLVEMARGVQHPTRGLFLRTFLSQASRAILPDTGSEYEGEGGDVTDAVDFVLKNFTEMNKLWVRMQHQGPARDKAKRTQERNQLRDLVGKNLLVLSQLEGLSLDLYQGTVLPRVLEQVVNCKDDIAQPYLMDAVIQVFPDELHLATVDALLEACLQLQPSVKAGEVLAGLMRRLAKYANEVQGGLEEVTAVDLFEKLCQTVTKFNANEQQEPADIAATHIELQAFAVAVYGDNLQYADRVLSSCADSLAPHGVVSEARASRNVVKVLSAPLDAYDVLEVLSLQSYPRVLGLLEESTSKQMALTVVRALMKGGKSVSDIDKVEMLFSFIAPLVSGPEEEDEEDFSEEQSLVARLVHFLQAEQCDTQYGILKAAYEHFKAGGHRRMVYTLPPMIFSALRLVRALKVSADEAGDPAAMAKPLSKVLKFLLGMITALGDVDGQHNRVYRLHLQAAQAASAAGQEEFAYKFVEQAFELYETAIPTAKEKMTALQLAVGAVRNCVVFGEESRSSLLKTLSGYATSLVKKPDACRAVYTCSHLFWGEEEGALCDGDTVYTHLKRALKVANQAKQQAANTAAAAGEGGALQLFVECLNKYLYFFDKGVSTVTDEVVNAVLEVIANEQGDGGEAAGGPAGDFFKATVQHITAQKAKGVERYDAVVLR